MLLFSPPPYFHTGLGVGVVPVSGWLQYPCLIVYLQSIILKIKIRKHTHCFKSTRLNWLIRWRAYQPSSTLGISRSILESPFILSSVRPFTQQACSGCCVSQRSPGYNVVRNNPQTLVANNQILISSLHYCWLCSKCVSASGIQDKGAASVWDVLSAWQRGKGAGEIRHLL